MRAYTFQIATCSLLTAAFLCSVPALAMPGGGGGGGGGSMGGAAPAPRPSQSPEEVAAKHYEKAHRARDRALAYEEQARVSDEKGFLGLGSRPSEKARGQWRKAIEAYGEAIQKAPNRYYRAHSEICFAQRKLGDFEESLASAERALQRIPGYPPALECRGQVQLRLSRLGEARKAYERLRRLNGELADRLMDAMKDWLAQNAEGPVDGLGLAEVEAFRNWVREHEGLASRSESALPGVGSAE